MSGSAITIFSTYSTIAPRHHCPRCGDGGEVFPWYPIGLTYGEVEGFSEKRPGLANVFLKLIDQTFEPLVHQKGHAVDRHQRRPEKTRRPAQGPARTNSPDTCGCKFRHRSADRQNEARGKHGLPLDCPVVVSCGISFFWIWSCWSIRSLNLSGLFQTFTSSWSERGYPRHMERWGPIMPAGKCTISASFLTRNWAAFFPAAT